MRCIIPGNNGSFKELTLLVLQTEAINLSGMNCITFWHCSYRKSLFSKGQTFSHSTAEHFSALLRNAQHVSACLSMSQHDSARLSLHDSERLSSNDKNHLMRQHTATSAWFYANQGHLGTQAAAGQQRCNTVFS